MWFIREDETRYFKCALPGIEPEEGDTIDEVLERIDRKVKAYYGEDVVVEVAPNASH